MTQTLSPSWPSSYCLFALLCCMAWLLLPQNGNAQVFTDINPNAAALAVGGATIALPEPLVGIANEGQLVAGKRRGIWANATSPYAIENWQVAQLQAFTSLGKSSGVGLDVSSGGISALRESRVQLMYGRKMGDKWALGAAFGAVNVSVQEYGAAWGIDYRVSVLARALPNLSIGASVQNPFAAQLGGADLPIRLRVGACWQTSKLLNISTEWNKVLDRRDELRVGARYAPMERLALLAGANLGETTRLALGAGVRLGSGIWLHLAAEWNPYLNLSPAASASWMQ